MKNFKKATFADLKLKVAYILLVAVVLLAPIKIIHASEDLLPMDPEAGVSDPLPTDPNDEQTTDPNDDQTTDLKDDQTTDLKDDQTTDLKDDQTTDLNDDQTTDPNDGDMPIMPAGGMMPIMPLDLELGFTSDLSNILLPFPNGVTITDLLDQPVANLALGKDYKITLSFQENSTYQLAYDENDVLFYQLPSAIKIIDPLVDQPILSGTTQIGTYSIDANGYVTVKFDDVKEVPTGSGNWQQTTGTNFIDNYIDAFFKLEIKAQFGQYGEDVKIDFSNDYSYTVTILEEPVEAALSITKIASPSTPYYDGQVTFDPTVNKDWKIHYTSVITATEGTVTDPSFHDDAMGYFTLTDTSFLESVQVSINSGPLTDYTLEAGPGTPNTYYWINATDGTGGFYLTFPDGTALSEGENITINYTIDAGKLISANGSDPYHFQYGQIYTNTAYASGKDGADSPLDVNAKLTVRVPGRNYTIKSGVLSADGKTIDWTATAGDGIEPLTGKTIYDNLQSNTMSFSTPITVKLYAADHTTQIGDEVTLPMPTGQSFTYDVTTPGVYYADFTYSVNVNDLSAAYYSNGISIVEGGKNYGYSAGVLNPNTDMKIAKIALLTEVDGYRAIQWTIKWSVPPAYYKHSLFLNDNLQGAAMGYTNVPQHFTVTVNSGGTDLGEIAADDPDYGWWWTNDANQLHWYLYFSLGGNPLAIPRGTNYQPVIDADSLSPFENGADITVTYYTMLEGPNASTLTDGYAGKSNTYGQTGDTLLAAVLDPALTGYPKDVENIVNFWGHITSDKTGYGWTGVYTPIAKTGVPGGGSGQYVDYRVTINSLAPNYTSNVASSFDMGNDPVFTDTFDSDMLEYVANSFYIMSYPNVGCYFGPYDSSKQDELITGGNISNYIMDNGNGTSTITIHLKDLMQITGPTTNYSNYATAPPWIGPPTGVYSYPYPANPAVPTDWWSAKNLWASQPMIRIFYRLKLKDGADPGKHEVFNEASINTVWTSGNTSTVGKEVVTKDMQLTAAGNIMAVTINVNPQGLTLAPDSVNGLYEIEDQMNDTLAAFLSSIVIQKETSPGSGNWVTQEIDPVYGNEWSYKTTSDNQIFFTVPDATSIRITYNALVKGAVGDNVDVKNTVSILGKYTAESEKSFQLQKTDASAGGSAVPVTLYKQDEDDGGIYLQGAVFKLYMSKYYPGLSSSTPAFTKDGVSFYYVDIGTTDENGQIFFDNQYLSYSTNAIYALEETAAPAGYLMPSDPYIFFTLGTVPVSGDFTPAVLAIADYVNVTNELAGGPILPGTGGSGRTIFLVAGLTLLVLAGGALKLARK